MKVHLRSLQHVSGSDRWIIVTNTYFIITQIRRPVCCNKW